MNGEWYFTKGNYYTNAPRESLSTLHYKFGANRLYIGEALADIVRYIAEDIDGETCWLSGEDFFHELDYGKLICKIEDYVAECCYNNNYGNGYYRYPVKFIIDGSRYVTKRGIADVPKESLKTMYYDFGSNRLYIGEALCEIIQFIIDEYDCCFELLEEKNDDELKQERNAKLKQFFWECSPAERIELLKQDTYAQLFPEYVKLFKEGDPDDKNN